MFTVSFCCHVSCNELIVCHPFDLRSELCACCEFLTSEDFFFMISIDIANILGSFSLNTNKHFCVEYIRNHTKGRS